MTNFGLLTPVISLETGVFSEWERAAGIAELRQVAEAGDRLGYDYLTCSEHVLIPASGAGPGVEVPSERYWDPLSTFGYLAAVTSRIRLTTSILVLGYHHPLEVAKRYGTLDAMSGGRVTLGVGVGYLEPEFRLLGASYEDRGARADDAIPALRAAFGRRQPSYEGKYYSFSDVIIDPCAVQQNVPIWVGGRSKRSLRRAVELGDGWCPFAVSPRKAAEWLAEAAQTPAWQQRSAPLDVVLHPRRALDPLGNPQEALGHVRDTIAAGATSVTLRFVHESLSQYLEQLDAMRPLLASL